MNVSMALFSFAAFFLLLGCSQGGSSAPTAPTAPSISVQPMSQSATIGATTTFSVEASGTGPITYQWRCNGGAIVGATGPSFTAPAAVPSDHEAFFTVTLTNPMGTVVSSPAILSVAGSPRPPKAGDLRFKDVDAFPFGLHWNLNMTITGNLGVQYGNQAGTPLLLGSPGPVVPNGDFSDTAWSFLVGDLPEGSSPRTTAYEGGSLDGFPADVLSPGLATPPVLNDPNVIVSSLDFCSGQKAYAIELVKASTFGGYSSKAQTLGLGAVQDEATQEGALGRVITAITLNADQVTYYSYGWQGDPSSVYETKIYTATADNLVIVATMLAQDGYLITASGGNNNDGFVLVGTRVKGDTTPRAIMIGTGIPSRGYAVVMSVWLSSSTASAPGTLINISEM